MIWPGASSRRPGGGHPKARAGARLRGNSLPDGAGEKKASFWQSALYLDPCALWGRLESSLEFSPAVMFFLARMSDMELDSLPLSTILLLLTGLTPRRAWAARDL